MSDLTDVATEEPIRFGGQIADLVQVAVILAVSEPGEGDGTEPTRVHQPPTADRDCSDVQAALERDGEVPLGRAERRGRSR